MEILDTDILIAGAGPAGSAASLQLCKNGIRHFLVDKAVFPRDKICGDALSGKVIDQLKKLDETFVDEIYRDEEKFLGSFGVRFVAPNGNSVDVPFAVNPSKLKHAPGFISKRINFDHFLFQKINRSYATVMEETELLQVETAVNAVSVKVRQKGIEKVIRCKLIIGAEGDRSLIARKLAGYHKEEEHYCAGIRAYYKGVKAFHSQNFIELHFLKEMLPGYLWVFPLPGNAANVGVGMLSAEVSRRKMNLKKTMFELIETYPALKERFAEAQLTGEVKGWGLPLGTKERRISGNNFMLVGDAASLIDPFSGEGIGNGITSGMIAASHAQEAISANRFDHEFLAGYDRKIYAALGSELSLSRKMHKLSKYEWPFNMVIKNASRNKELRDLISCMFEDVNMREKLKDPKFYFRLLFNRN